MGHQTVPVNKTKRILDIPTAAEYAGFSSRHFRRIIEEDKIPVLNIGRKMFILSRDLETWRATRGEARLCAALNQVDGWVRETRVT
jgi:hypothetical protein